MFSIRISPQRARKVIREITEGSRTHVRFYAMLMASAMIACFGLIANSTAVVIGAMLVSPLMTPIFGIALGLLRGSPRLLGRAVTTEAVGVILAIGSAYLLGLTQLTAGEATPEMLARTQPNLMDLLVAVFAGFAGAYALVDERISPALPGVAIATAIVPPLSTCGLCLSLGAWSGALGALLLFLANFVSILLISLVTFGLAGLTRSHVRSFRTLARRFGPALFAFVIMATVLTHSLQRILYARMLQNTIENTLIKELAEDYGSDLDKFVHNSANEQVQVLATVRSHRTIPPARVSGIQDSLQKALGTPVELVVRTIRSRDVSSVGSSLQVTPPDLNGEFLTSISNNSKAREALASQVLREEYENEPGFELTRLEYGTASRGEGLVVAYVNTIRRLAIHEIASAENELRKRLDDPELKLLMRVNSAALEFRSGPVRVEWTNWSGASESEINRIDEIEKSVREAISELAEVVPIHVHFNYQDDRRRILVEVVGPKPVTPESAMLVQDRLVEELGPDTEINLWYRNEFIVSGEGYSTYEKLTAPLLKQRRRLLQEIFRADQGVWVRDNKEEPSSQISVSVSMTGK